VLLKFSILAWRLLRDRLPTKNNLVWRGILQVEAARCVAGCGFDEPTSRLFIHCDMFGSLWQHTRSWIGVSRVDPHNIHDHFIQFIHCIGHSRTRRDFLQLIWLLCIWTIWNARNNMIFNNVQATSRELIEKVKFNFYWWLKANRATFVYDSQRWWSDPLLCLGID
jgi:hypothetical protein